MLDGKISPGNGHELALLLAQEDEKGTTVYLQKLVEQAQNHHVSNIVLSNEVLIRLFSNQKILDILVEAAAKAGIKYIKALCFIRNIYSHALSLYKHRAKTGKHPNYDTWFNSDYETLRVFNPFLSIFKNYAIEWSFRLYKKDPKHLEEVFYNDFLSLKTPDSKVPKSVNPSLSLQNIAAIQTNAKKYTGIHEVLYAKLISKKEFNEENPALLNQFYDSAQHYFNTQKNVISAIQALFPEQEAPQFSKTPLMKGIDNPAFSNEKIVQSAITTYKRQWPKLFMKRAYRNVLSLLKNKKTSAVFDSERYGGSLRS